MSEKKEKYFAAKLPSPRPNFPYDMSDEEKNIMDKHTEFWQKLLTDGTGIITGPVLDPKGAYGFGVVIAESLEKAYDLLKGDPAQKINEYEIYEMLADVRRNQNG